MVRFEISEVANKHTPTGGVERPIDKAVTIKTTKCIGSMPTDDAVGKTTGVKIRSAAVMSINIPTIINTTPMRRSTIVGSCENERIMELTFNGSLSMAKI